MKNIHLLPTDKPSRLCYDKDDNLSFAANTGWRIADGKQHLYITSDEEVKEKDWVLCSNGNIKKVTKSNSDDRFIENWQKIILTTDQDLIKNGVQAIDDTFLEWFVNHSECEEVEIKVEFIQTPDNLKDGFYYKIIIPTEKPKSPNMKKKTIEEAAERYQETTVASFAEESFKAGAEWYAKNQSEQMYSEEEVNHYVNDVMGGCNLKADEWFIQFKLLNNKN
jgi:hypothetical protein